MKAKMSPVRFFGGMIAAYFVLATVLALLVSAVHPTGATGGAILGGLLWLGPAAAIGLTGHLASDRHMGIYLIDTTFQLVCLVTQGAILGAWH